MENLNTFILERLKITSKTYNKQFSCKPKTKEELKNILDERVFHKDSNANLNDIDVSEITDMSYLFNNIYPHNIDISEWDVSNVENMEAMFWNCPDFDTDLSNWNVSKVKNMINMFRDCHKFTGKGLENWNVENVDDMAGMFYNCIDFNANLGEWNVESVKNIENMFSHCKKMNGDWLENWNPKSLKGYHQDVFFDTPVVHNKPSWYKRYYD